MGHSLLPSFPPPPSLSIFPSPSRYSTGIHGHHPPSTLLKCIIPKSIIVIVKKKFILTPHPFSLSPSSSSVLGINCLHLNQPSPLNPLKTNWRTEAPDWPEDREKLTIMVPPLLRSRQVAGCGHNRNEGKSL